MSWELIGEDCGASYHSGLLPLDWRTKAKAILDYSREVDRGAALEAMKDATLRHGVECYAPPGEWFGGTWVGWSLKDAPEGWSDTERDHEECDDGVYSECRHPEMLCLRLERYDEDVVAKACAEAPPEIHLVTAGEGWPWLSRVIDRVTVLVL